MRFTAAWLVVLLCVPRLTSQASDKNPPEALLPSTCIAYFRYDGYESHKKSYDKTALGKAMKDDLGEALEYAFSFFDDLFAGSIPAWKNNREAAHACLAGLWKNGIVLGLELAEDYKSDWRLTIVLPQGISPPYRHVLPQVAKALEQYEADPLEFKPRTINERKVHEAKNKKDVTIAWWYESPHAVVTIGTLPPEDVIAIADGKKPNFTGHRDYRRLAEFKAYETDIRGFVDLKGIIERACAPTKKSEDWSSWYDVLVKRALCHRSGLFGLETATVHLGFDGKYQRSTVKIHVVEPAKRVGLLKLPGAGLTWNGKIDASPIPPDAASVAIRHIAWQRVADEWLALAQIVESWTVLNEWRNRGLRSILFPGLSDIGKMLVPENPAPDEQADVSQPSGSNWKAVKVFVKEIGSALETTCVAYDSPSEGPLSLGSVWAFKIKDNIKLDQALGRFLTALEPLLKDDGLKIDKRMYRGTELVMLGMRGLPFTPTYALHDGWWVVSLLPQPVKGFIWRGEPGRRCWTQPDYLVDVYAKARANGPAAAKLGSVHVDDPKPSVNLGLSLLPLLASAAGGLEPKPFDVSKLPHAQAVTEPLFPNVSFFFDDGDALRWESHFSLDLSWWYLSFFFSSSLFSFARG